ncbi:hypothetical protein HRbin34_00580 [bacterium HR34]|nr:hypothetical protein HRbin34_00580 [bacterium HR34]
MVDKILIILGIILIILGLFLYFKVDRSIPLDRLPGDIYIDKGNFKLYFPIATSLILSAIISLVFWFLTKKL